MEYYVRIETKENMHDLTVLCEQKEITFENGLRLDMSDILWLGENTVTYICDKTIKFFDKYHCEKELGVKTISLKEYKKQIGIDTEQAKEEETFTRGELVEVSYDMEKWEKRIFLVEIKGVKYDGVLTVLPGDEWLFKKGYNFRWFSWKYIRKINHTELFGKTYNTQELKEAIKDLTPIK